MSHRVSQRFYIDFAIISHRVEFTIFTPLLTFHNDFILISPLSRAERGDFLVHSDFPPVSPGIRHPAPDPAPGHPGTRHRPGTDRALAARRPRHARRESPQIL